MTSGMANAMRVERGKLQLYRVAAGPCFRLKITARLLALHCGSLARPTTVVVERAQRENVRQADAIIGQRPLPTIQAIKL